MSFSRFVGLISFTAGILLAIVFVFHMGTVPQDALALIDHYGLLFRGTALLTTLLGATLGYVAWKRADIGGIGRSSAIAATAFCVFMGLSGVTWVQLADTALKQYSDITLYALLLISSGTFLAIIGEKRRQEPAALRVVR